MVAKAPKGIQFNIGFKEQGGSEVQSVVFTSEEWDEDAAKTWLDDHDMESGKMDKTTSTLRFRQKPPEDYVRFRMITPGAQVAKALAAKMETNPATEYQTATADTTSPLIRVRYAIILSLKSVFIS